MTRADERSPRCASRQQGNQEAKRVPTIQANTPRNARILSRELIFPKLTRINTPIIPFNRVNQPLYANISRIRRTIEQQHSIKCGVEGDWGERRENKGATSQRSSPRGGIDSH